MIRDDARDGQMASGQVACGVSCRYAVDFAVEGDVRYCSHRDMIRLFSRAFARADLPVRFSEGFNPHPRFSLPLPRPVGVASTLDRMVVELVRPMECEELLRRLSDSMPHGLSILQIRMLDPAEQCQPLRVGYVVAVFRTDHGADDRVDPMDLASRVARLLASPPVLVERKNKKDGKPKPVDIHPFIDALSVIDGGLAMTLRVSQEGTAKPSEVCAALGITDKAVPSWTRRVRIEWQ